MYSNPRIFGEELVKKVLYAKVSKFTVSEEKKHLFATPEEISKWVKELFNQEITSRQVRNCLPAIIGTDIDGVPIEYSIGGYKIIFRDDPPSRDYVGPTGGSQVTKELEQIHQGKKEGEKHCSSGGGLLIPAAAVIVGLLGLGLLAWWRRRHGWRPDKILFGQVQPDVYREV